MTERFRETLSEGQLVLIDYLNRGGRIWGAEASVANGAGWSYRFELRSGVKKYVVLTPGEIAKLRDMGLVDLFTRDGMIGPC